MLEMIYTKIWEILQEKEVSLVMLFDRDGRILWHRGRDIVGTTIAKGEGFSKSYIDKCIHSGTGIDRQNVVIQTGKDTLSESAFRLVIKCILIYPLENDLFLYIDSGKKESFTPCERDMFKMLGDMLAGTIRQIKSHQNASGDIAGSSQAIQTVKKLVLNFSIVAEPILLKGETGVGKNVVAEQIHRYSGRRGKFVVVHTPSIQELLFESEIFGHRKGSFTDAKYDQRGLVAEADGGTLFFDEISEIPASFQAKLLRFIETKKYRVLGETTERHADIRIITATNRDLFKTIESGEFREDLYYRLHVLEIEIPPLRQRKEDIRILVQEKQEYLQGKTPGPGFWEVIMEYSWPGNVRELMTCLKRVGIMSNNPSITGEDLQSAIGLGRPKKINPDCHPADEHLWQEILAGASFWDVLWPLFIARDVDRRFTKKILRKAYEQSNHRFKKMIDLLNIPENDYQNFMSLMYKYKLDPRETD